jgi:hypothetical protein
MQTVLRYRRRGKLAFLLSLVPLVGIYALGPMGNLSVIRLIPHNGTILLSIFYIIAPVSALALGFTSWHQLAKYSGGGSWYGIVAIAISFISLILFVGLVIFAIGMTPNFLQTCKTC